MIFVMPETDRFCNIQLLDAWTNTITVLEEAGTYAITLSGWEGELPEDVIRVESPTASVWLLGRTVLDGTEDLPNVYSIHEQMNLYPLSAHAQGGVYDAPTGTYVEENDFVPLNKVLSMTPVEFFNKANELMEAKPSAAEPEDTTNWMPVSDGAFHLILRVYLPDMDALDAWQAPVITVN